MFYLRIQSRYGFTVTGLVFYCVEHKRGIKCNLGIRSDRTSFLSAFSSPGIRVTFAPATNSVPQIF